MSPFSSCVFRPLYKSICLRPTTPVRFMAMSIDCGSLVTVSIYPAFSNFLPYFSVFQNGSITPWSGVATAGAISKNLHEGCPNKERLELVRKCNDRIEKIVEHLREFSRQKEPVFQDLDINEPIENALLITGQQLLDHAIVIVKALGEDLPKILGDTNQLEQVFLNLIANARDAMDEVTGTKELRICSYLSHEEGTAYVVASIKDTGVGIPADIRNKVFDPFFSTKPVGKGTGLGLSLCFGIIESHAGRMEIQSSEGSGTEVLVYIPLEREKE